MSNTPGKCPFCKSNEALSVPAYASGDFMAQVVCDCGARGPWGYDDTIEGAKESAIHLWDKVAEAGDE